MATHHATFEPVSIKAAALALLVVWGASASGANAQPSDGAGPSYPKTLLGTVGGGVLGAAAVGGTLGLLLEATDDDTGIVSGAVAGFILGAPVGYALGQAFGASWGSATAAVRIPRRRLVLPALLWTGAGLAVYGLIGDGFDPEDGNDLTSWYVGAVVGGTISMVGMSVTAHRMAVGASREPDGVALRLSPSREHGVMVVLSVALGR